MIIPSYYVHYTDLAPAELTELYPTPAKYGRFSLFITGEENPASVVDIASMGFNYPFTNTGSGLTAAQLDTIIDTALDKDTPSTADQYKISKVQVNYLHKSRVKQIDL
tara:strand:- start:165 stop:488 length:324 start_codon:yes stop_codon:yes gene_type:complete